jgi:hypothetical protein
MKMDGAFFSSPSLPALLCPACPVAPEDRTGVKFFAEKSSAYLSGVAPEDGTGVKYFCLFDVGNTHKKICILFP